MMKIKLTILFFILSLIGNSQINIVSQQQKQKEVEQTIERPPFTRLIIVGASIMANTFFNLSVIESAMSTTYPAESLTIHNRAVIGSTSTANVSQIDGILADYTNPSDTLTFVLIHTGGNDVTLTRPFSTATELQKTTLENNITYILDAIETKGFTPILSEISFRNYDDTTYLNEKNGSKPYNDNIVHPLILARTPEFAYPDGTSYFQPYNLFFNDWETYLSSDDIHPAGAGITALKTHFVNAILPFIFNGTIPTKIEKE